MGRGKGEGSLYKNAKGLWCATVELPPSLDGKRRRKTVTSTSKATVVSKLRQLQKEKSSLGDLPTRSWTMAEWMTYWIDEIAPRTLRPRTIVTYRGSINQQIIPRIGTVKIHALSPPRIRQLIDTVEREKSAAMASRVFGVLSKAMKAAVRDRVLTADPTSHMERPKSTPAPQEALTLDEAVQVLRALPDDPHGTLWATILLTGARRNEVLGLERDRVGDTLDLSWQLLQIKRSHMDGAPSQYQRRYLQESFYLVRPKSGAGDRQVPLVEPLRTILQGWVERTDPQGLVFTRADGGPIRPNWVTEEWRELLRRVGVNDKVKLHGARHTVVDLMYLSGAPEDVIQRVVGHSSRAMTRSYQTTAGQSQRVVDAMESMSRLLGR